MMLITSLDHPLRRGDIVNLDKVVVSTARTQAEKVAMFADGKSFDHSLAIVLATTRDTLDLRPLRWWERVLFSSRAYRLLRKLAL